MKRDIYPEIMDYLTGTTYRETQRHLKKETLEKFQLGVGQEKFRNDTDQPSWFDSIYFPLYSPKDKKQQPFWKPSLEKKQGVELQAEIEMNSETMELVRMNKRAVGKEIKHRTK